MKKLLEIVVLGLLGCNFVNAAELSSKYDGAYTYTHFCKGDDSLKYDGSQFIINEGMLSNDRGGAGRWIIKKNFKVSSDGKLKFKGVRKDRKYTVKGKFIIEGKILLENF